MTAYAKYLMMEVGSGWCPISSDRSITAVSSSWYVASDLSLSKAYTQLTYHLSSAARITYNCVKIWGATSNVPSIIHVCALARCCRDVPAPNTSRRFLLSASLSWNGTGLGSSFLVVVHSLSMMGLAVDEGFFGWSFAFCRCRVREHPYPLMMCEHQQLLKVWCRRWVGLEFSS